MKKGVKEFHKNKTMGALLTMAIHDVEEQVKKGIVLNLSVWIIDENINFIFKASEAKKSKPCEACLAGCALLNHGLYMGDASGKGKKIINAMTDSLDSMRKGHWRSAYQEFYGRYPRADKFDALDSLSGEKWDGVIKGRKMKRFIKGMKEAAAILIVNKI